MPATISTTQSNERCTPAGDITTTVTQQQLGRVLAGTHPSSAFVIADLADVRRWIGTSTDSDLLSEGVTAELIGRQVLVTDNCWAFADDLHATDTRLERFFDTYCRKTAPDAQCRPRPATS